LFQKRTALMEQWRRINGDDPADFSDAAGPIDGGIARLSKRQPGSQRS
jgi:hypothetical protein